MVSAGVQIKARGAEKEVGAKNEMMETAEAAATYFRVSLDLLEPGKVLPCDVWLQHESGVPVLYRSSDLEFSQEHVDRLLSTGVQSLLIAFKDAPRWAAYLGDQLREQITDQSESFEKRMQALVESARVTMESAFSVGRSTLSSLSMCIRK